MQHLKEKLACAFENDMTNLANIYHSTFESLKIGTLMESFYPKQKIRSLKFTGEFWVMIMKNDTKFEEELIC